MSNQMGDPYEVTWDTYFDLTLVNSCLHCGAAVFAQSALDSESSNNSYYLPNPVRNDHMVFIT